MARDDPDPPAPVAPVAPAPAGGRARAKRARLDPEARRAQLIEVALGCLDRDRDTVFSVDEVADAAGVSRSLVYAYFGDRNGLAAEAYVRILDRIDRDLGLELPSDEGELRAIVAACMAFAQENRAAWRMVVSDPSRQHPLVQAARAERAERIATHWAGFAGEGAAAAQLAAEASLGLLESGVLHWLGHPDVPAEQAASLLATILWAGLTGPRPACAPAAPATSAASADGA